MREDWEDMDEELDDEAIEEGASNSGKFTRLLGSDSRKYKLSGMFKDWFLDYSSYVILQRAVPHIVDGLKPVQRRVLHAMWTMDDGNMTKVANIVGQTMPYHPHGDASILGALVQLGQKNLTVDCQGNWGNILTGDSNAAARYIEARLSKFAKEVVFDPKVTNYMKSYDGRNDEPTELPVRFPLLLAQGTEGIAVGMSSKILPHNFNELIDGSIAILKGEDYELYPDFPTGGYADCSKYNDGRRKGSVKVRAKIEKIDKNTIAITEVPFGRTTGMLIESILKAKDKGKIKIKKVEDMTTNKVEVLIHLANDVSPDKTIDALYACTDCEYVINPNACVIKDNKPQFLSVKDILEYDTFHTKELLGRELQIKLDELKNDWFYTSLEQIFFENRIYKLLENEDKTWEAQLDNILSEMKKYEEKVGMEIKMEHILKLVEKPVRKISKFDSKVLDLKLEELEKSMRNVQKDLDHLTEYTIAWFENLKKKYGAGRERRTVITSLENITATKVVSNNAKLYANLAEGFVGTGLKKDDNGTYLCDCSDISEIIVIGRNGKYIITKVSEKAFFGKDLLYAGVFTRGDERTIYNVIYRDGNSSVSYAKRFAITSVSRDKEYDITTGTAGSKILYFSVNHNGEAESVRVYLRPKPNLKKSSLEYDFSTLAIKGKSSRGNLVSKNAINKITLKSQGTSTIGGKEIWYDADIQKLNDEKHGLFLGEFEGEDKVLAIFKDGTFETTTYDISNRYQGELLKIEKFDAEKVYTALYWDSEAKAFYVKRFTFTESNNQHSWFISPAKGSYLVDLSEETYARVMLVFGGKFAGREPEFIEAYDFIAEKGITAKGKRCHRYDLSEVKFVESIPREEPVEDVPEDTTEDVLSPVENLLSESSDATQDSESSEENNGVEAENIFKQDGGDEETEELTLF